MIDRDYYNIGSKRGIYYSSCRSLSWDFRVTRGFISAVFSLHHVLG